MEERRKNPCRRATDGPCTAHDEINHTLTGHTKALFGEDGRGGIVGWSNQINGHIKGMKYVLGLGLTVITGINVAFFVAVLRHMGG